LPGRTQAPDEAQLLRISVQQRSQAAALPEPLQGFLLRLRVRTAQQCGKQLCVRKPIGCATEQLLAVARTSRAGWVDQISPLMA
jgi:hypothetical protein